MQNSISDEFFGSLTWDALVDRWSGEMAFPDGHAVKIMIGTPDGENDQTVTPEAREACLRVMAQQAAFARKAAEDLLGIHNEGWHHVEDALPLTTEQFEARLTLDSVYLESWGSAAVYFDDGDLFWGHVIRVEQDADGSFPCEALFEG